MFLTGVINKIDGDTYIGHLNGYDDSLLVLVTTDDVMIGSVTTGSAQYQIRYAGNGIHMVREVNTAALPAEFEPITIELTEEELAADPGVQEDSDAYIDVLTVYTAVARAAAGGTTAIRNLINLAITEANIANANSLVTSRKRNVGAKEITDVDPSGQT